MKIYISGPITGVEDWEDRFKAAEEELRKRKHSVLSPRFIETVLDYEDYMKIDLAMVEVADAIYLLDGWQNSNGAKRELAHAIELNLNVYRQGEEF